MNPGDLSWKELEELGECRIYERTKPAETVERVRGARVIITNKVVIDRAIIGQLPELKYIGVTATGYNVVDIAAATESDIVVTNIPAYSTDSVAQLVFSHILNVANRVELHAHSVREGEWSKNPDFAYWKTPQVELAGKTLGIVGLGQIGRKVAEIGLAFGMKVIFQNRSIRTDIPENLIQTDLTTVFQQSDFLSLNCPLTAENAGFVNRKLIGSMKKNAVLINTGRGGLINERDLAEALNAGTIAAACLDVLSTEPPAPDNPLISARNCFITPHVAWATREARQRLLSVTVDNLRSFLAGSPKNVIKS
jgi:glycerate dehydrogenase